MADPISWMMLAGAAVSAVGAVSQANAAKASHQYNATMLERQAIVANDQAAGDAARFEQQSQQALGSIVAGFGAAGVAGDGSPMDVLRMSAANAKLDQETLLYRGRLKATGYHNDASLSLLAGDTAEEQGGFNAASSLLTGVGRTSVNVAARGTRFRTTESGIN